MAEQLSRSIRPTLSARARRTISRGGHADISTGVGDSVDARMTVNGMIGDETGFVPLHPDDVPIPFPELLNDLIESLRKQLPARYQPAVIPLTKDEGGLSSIYFSAISCLPYAHHGSLDSLVPFYDFCRQSGLKLNQIEGPVKLASSSGWFCPMKNVCIMTARRSIVTTDGAGQCTMTELELFRQILWCSFVCSTQRRNLMDIIASILFACLQQCAPPMRQSPGLLVLRPRNIVRCAKPRDKLRATSRVK